jgi:hypothetical protein
MCGSVITFLGKFGDVPYISIFPFGDIFQLTLKGEINETGLEMDSRDYLDPADRTTVSMATYHTE